MNRIPSFMLVLAAIFLLFTSGCTWWGGNRVIPGKSNAVRTIETKQEGETKRGRFTFKFYPQGANMQPAQLTPEKKDGKNDG